MVAKYLKSPKWLTFNPTPILRILGALLLHEVAVAVLASWKSKDRNTQNFYVNSTPLQQS